MDLRKIGAGVWKRPAEPLGRYALLLSLIALLCVLLLVDLPNEQHRPAPSAGRARQPVAPADMSPSRSAAIEKPARASSEWMQADIRWLLQQPDHGTTIQLNLFRIDRQREIERYIHRELAGIPSGQLHLIQVAHGGKRYIGVYYGSFSSSREAKQALKVLPRASRRYGAAIKQFKNLRAEAGRFHSMS